MRQSGDDCRIVSVSSMGHSRGSFDLTNIQGQKKFDGSLFYGHSKLFQVRYIFLWLRGRVYPPRGSYYNRPRLVCILQIQHGCFGQIGGLLSYFPTIPLKLWMLGFGLNIKKWVMLSPPPNFMFLRGISVADRMQTLKTQKLDFSHTTFTIVFKICLYPRHFVHMAVLC